ncbi:cytochrome P450 [Xylariales sp. PMI_506]|nr:cytochrome P450 [Xylariales sp. PMI_506]
MSWSSLASLAAIGLFTLLLWRRYLSPISDVPGPFAASFTRLWHMNRILKGDQSSELVRLHDRYGHFVRVSYDEVSVSHPDAVKKILLAPLHKAPWYKVHALPDYRFQSPMSTTDPKKKVEKSKYIAPAYTLSNLLQQEEFISRVMEPFFNWMDSYAVDKKPMKLCEFFSYATFDVVGEIAFSQQFGFLEKGQDIGNAIANSLALNAYVAVAGYFRWVHIVLLANPIVTWLGLLPMGHLFNTAQAAVKARDNNQDAHFDALAHWYKQHRDHPNDFSLREIGTQALAAIGAGSDTVACALQSFVYHMIRHPSAWQTVRNEIDEARKSGRCYDRVISYADAQSLAYLQACIKESLRIFGPVPMGLGRIVPKGGLTIGDRTIPAGFIVSVNPWVIHNSKELWGEDAREFNPDRWLKAGATALEKYYIPSGAGYNSCPGQNVTKIELSKFTSTLVRDYDIRRVDPEQPWKWKAYFTVLPHSWSVLIDRRKDEE